MKKAPEFFNKLTKELDTTYFPNVKYYRDNKNTTKIHYAAECFNNGVLTYTKLIDKISAACKDTKENIHKIVSKYIADFEGFEYKNEKKFGEYTILPDAAPKIGDRMICIQKKNFNYKLIATATKQQVELGIIDTKNWKVILDF